MIEQDRNHYAFQGTKIGHSDLKKIEADFRHKMPWYAHFLKKYLPVDLNAPILDVPCGHGNFLYFLKHQGYRNVRGIDGEPRRIAIAHQLGLSVAELGDAFDAVQKADDIAMIVCLDFLEHIEKFQVPEFLRDCRQALRKGGVLIVRLPFTDSLLGAHDLGNDFTHKWAANSGVIEGLFLEAGFTHVVVKDERPVPYKPLNYIRLFIFHLMKALTNAYLILVGLGPLKIWSRSGYVIGIK
jgi:SAM-dependent methyltransferase